jgi:hypothetical protein
MWGDFRARSRPPHRRLKPPTTVKHRRHGGRSRAPLRRGPPFARRRVNKRRAAHRPVQGRCCRWRRDMASVFRPSCSAFRPPRSTFSRTSAAGPERRLTVHASRSFSANKTPRRRMIIACRRRWLGTLPRRGVFVNVLRLNAWSETPPARGSGPRKTEAPRRPLRARR